MKNIFTITFLLFTSLVYSQVTQTIRGTILDKETNEPLFGASVVIKTLDPIQGTVTDIDGIYVLEKIPIGRHTIEISYLGYETQTASNLELKSGKQLVLNFGLEESIVKTEEVLIKAKKRNGEAINKIASVSAQEFKVEQAERYAGSFNDVARMAQNFAGVQGADDSRNDIVVRGNSPTGVLYRLDGVDIPNPNHFAASGTTGGPVSILNTNNISNSDFMTSAFPAEYSNALSGVFDIHLKNGNNQKHEFLGMISLNGLELGAEGPLSKKHKFSYIINYRYSLFGLLNNIGIKTGTTGAAVPNFQDVNFKLNFPYKKGYVSVWGVGGLSDIAFLDSEKEDEEVNLFSGNAEDLRFASSIGAFGVTNLHRFNKKTYLKSVVSIDAAQSTTDLDNIDSTSLKAEDFYNRNFVQGKATSRFVLNHKINSRHLIQVGLTNQLKFYSLSDSILFESDSSFTELSASNGLTLLSQAYAQWQFKLTQRLKLNTGINFQYFLLNNAYAVEPRIGMKWQFHNKQSLSVGYGYHSQLPALEIYFKETMNTNGEVEFLNRDLKMTKSHHFVLGYNWDFMKNTRFKAEMYLQLIENAPIEKVASIYSILNTGAGFREVFPDELTNGGTGMNYGIELTVEKFLNNGWYVLFNSSLFQSKYKGSDGVERNTAFNSNYTFNLLGGKEFVINPKKENQKSRKALLFDAKVVYNGGNRYVPIDQTASQLVGEAVYEFDKAYEVKHPDYFRADLNAGFKISFKKITTEFTFMIQNLTGHKNIFNQNFNASTGELEYTYQRGFYPLARGRILF